MGELVAFGAGVVTGVAGLIGALWLAAEVQRRRRRWW